MQSFGWWPGGAWQGAAARVAGVVIVSVVEAVDRDLAAMRKLSPELADSALAASARVLAQELDCGENSATSKSMCARALTETLDRLRELLPPEKTKDGVDEFSARLAAKRASAS